MLDLNILDDINFNIQSDINDAIIDLINIKDIFIKYRTNRYEDSDIVDEIISIISENEKKCDNFKIKILELFKKTNSCIVEVKESQNGIEF